MDTATWSAYRNDSTGTGSSSTGGDAMTSSTRVNSDQDLLLNVMYAFIGAFAITGNGLVIVVFARVPTMRRHLSNVFLYNQSIVDLMAGICLTANSLLDFTPDRLPRPIRDLYCRFWLTKVTLWACLLVSTYNVLAVTGERYFSIVHPVRHRSLFDRKFAKHVISVTWLMGGAFVFAYIVPTSGVDATSGQCRLYSVWPNPRVQRSVGCFIVLVQFFVPIAFISFGYARIFHRLADEASRATEVAVVVNPRGQIRRRVRRNVLRTLATVSACFVVCWTPNQLLYTAHNLGVAVDFDSTLYHASVAGVMLNLCCNPVVYALTYRRFQQAALRTFFPACARRHLGSDGGAMSTTGGGVDGASGYEADDIVDDTAVTPRSVTSERAGDVYVVNATG